MFFQQMANSEVAGSPVSLQLWEDVCKSACKVSGR
jgi:hypothetical protein